MFEHDQYQLLDFGNGRKLERFGALILDRPSPVATGRPAAPGRWSESDARFVAQGTPSAAAGYRGFWQPVTDAGRLCFACGDSPTIPSAGIPSANASANVPASTSTGVPVDVPAGPTAASPENIPPAWTIRHDGAPFVMRLQGSPFGHLGIFPEQSANWDRIYRWCLAFKTAFHRPPRLLNLFGYTGGSTLAALAAGAETTHLDAAGNVVARARQNAELSFGPGTPSRWMTEDAVRFVNREVKRAKSYDALVLDPPTYGHGAHGEVWRFRRDLPKLLSACSRLLTGPSPFLLLTCHVTDLSAKALTEMVAPQLDSLRTRDDRLAGRAEAMSLSSVSGRTLPAGLRFISSGPL